MRVQPLAAGASCLIPRYAAGARRVTFVENLDAVYNYQGQNRSSGNIGVILDPSLVDYSVNPTGPYNRRDSDLQNLSIFLEQKIGERTFAELSYNTQGIDRTIYQSGQGRTENAQLFADPHRLLPDGSPNPFAGALFFEGGRWNYIKNDQTTHNTRLLLSHEFEFGKWGNYRLAAMGEYERRSEANRNWVEAWEGSPFANQPENDANQVWRRYYVTPGVWSTYHSGSGPYNGNFLQNVPDPTTPGRFLNSTWVPFNQGGMRDAYEKQRTMLVGGHARYFDRRLVLGVGLRKDKLSVRTFQSDRDPTTNEWSLNVPGIEFQREDYSGTTRTLGAVGHVTRNISLFYNSSNSLDVPNTSHRILPDGRIPSNSDATGQDYGIGFSLFGGRMSARVNRFEVDMVGATGGGFGGTADNPTVLNERILDALLGAGVIPPQESDARRFITNNATIDRKVEGYELSVNGSVTPNWRLTLGYSYTDGFDSNIGPEVKAWAAETIPWYLQWSNVQTGVTGPGGNLMTVAEVVEQWQADVQRLRWVREGDLLLGNRKHKYSIFTRYTFSSGPLKRLYVGGGYRYQSAPPIGFDQDEMLQWGRSQDNVDALLGYRIQGKWGFLKKGVSLQLNVRNVLDKTEPFITSLAADNIRITRALIVEPRSWRLTANFEF